MTTLLRRRVGSTRDRVVLASLATFLIILISFATLKLNADLTTRGITSGFGYLFEPSAIPIDNPSIPYRPYENTYLRAFLVGVANTLLISTVGIACATVLGSLLGILRLSSHPLLAVLSKAYVELFRNIPVVLQLMFWYMALLHMPNVRQAVTFYDVLFISNRGVNVPALSMSGDSTSTIVLFGTAILCVAWYFVTAWWNVARWLRLTGTASLIVFFLSVIAADIRIDIPKKAGFSLAGGLNVSTEFAALLIGLTVYFSTYIGEILRSSMLSIPVGQWEGAKSLGLSWWHTLRLVIIPQALRRILPPLTNQYANLIKTSSLAVVIGYQDIVSISNTIINQTGQAIENIILIAAAYLIINTAISALLRWAEGLLPGCNQER